MRPATLPLVLLLLTLSSVFPSGNDRGQLYRSPLHNEVTSNYMAVARNLSPKHDFLGIYAVTLDEDGALSYRPYNRFPIGGYVLLKLAMLPFGDDLSAQLHAARILMLVSFIGAAVLAWLALGRLTGDRWIALTATLLSFSSFWLLYFNDLVATDVMPAQLGVMLAFHGMVVFVQEGRFRQLLVKTCAALLLGWQVYALLLPFIVFGLARELVRSQPLLGPGWSDRVRALIPKTRPCLVLGAVAVLFGAALVSFNFGHEYLALGGKIPLAELPSVESMIRRFGLSDWYHSDNPRFADSLAWLPYLEGQFRHIGGAMFPYGLIEPMLGSVVSLSWEMKSLPGIFTWGAAAFAACLIGLLFVPHKMLLATLAVAGFCWTLPMRHTIPGHDYHSVLYVGIPLTTFTVILLLTRKWSRGWFASVLPAAAIPVFVLSSAKVAGVTQDGGQAVVEAELMQDFQAISDRLGEGIVYIPVGQRHRLTKQHQRFFLAGSVVLLPKQARYRDKAGFLLMRHRDEGSALLTPDNRRMFLYDRVLQEASWDVQALGDPIIASDWSVHLKDGRLIWVSERCANREARFFLSMAPREAEGLPEEVEGLREDVRRPRAGRIDFNFRDFARIDHRGCVAAIDLPEYELASIRTGQVGEEGLLWEGEYDFGR